MEWNQVSEWFLKEIVTFGVRWIVVVVLGLIAGLFFGGFFGHRYRKVTLDIEALKKAGGDYRCSQSYARCRWSSRPWRYRRNKRELYTSLPKRKV